MAQHSREMTPTTLESMMLSKDDAEGSFKPLFTDFYRYRSQSSPSLLLHHVRNEPYEPRPFLSRSLHGSRTPPPSHKPGRLCGVCGDKAKSYHFGGISCDSCKAFFRRSVQNEAYKNFQCPYEGRCDITISSRKCCQYCRFRKCSSIGMEKGWVMTEEERSQLLKNRLERKQRLLSGTAASERKTPVSTSEPTSKVQFQLSFDESSVAKETLRFLSDRDVSDIEELINVYYNCLYEIPLPERSFDLMDRTDLLELFFTAIKQVSWFAQHLSSFSTHNQIDREILLRHGVLEICILRSILSFEEKSNRWINPCSPDKLLVTLDECRHCLSEVLIQKHLSFIRSMKALVGDDEPAIMLLAAIALNSPDRPSLTDLVLVSVLQERYCLVLKNYLRWRYGNDSGSVRYPRLLLRLPDLRELADAHQDLDLKLAQDEVRLIHTRLEMLHMQEAPRLQVNNDSSSIDSWSATSAPPFGKHWSLRKFATTLRALSPYLPGEDSTSSDSSSVSFRSSSAPFPPTTSQQPLHFQPPTS